MNIYVGNLPYGISEDELKGIFEEYGSVSNVKIISDKYSGKSKGFGFVDMVNDEEAKEAINDLNGTEVKGRNLKVNEARETTPDDRRKFRSER
ncbi:MAG: RNA-binding protein [Bacteroidales bacterium]|nr:RNA-binding protein [Bacteroidales bacterium]